LDLCIVRRAGALWFSLAGFHWFESASLTCSPGSLWVSLKLFRGHRE
jgi:hypothetical protein